MSPSGTEDDYSAEMVEPAAGVDHLERKVGTGPEAPDDPCARDSPEAGIQITRLRNAASETRRELCGNQKDGETALHTLPRLDSFEETGANHLTRKNKVPMTGWARLVSNQRPLACEAGALP